MLLDHQLMDMTWSDSLIECEENLLKTALQLTSVTPAQVSEIYGNLIRDRESLNRRFSELVTKSSLSEFIVNSGQILDINTQDKSVPIDHNIFPGQFLIAKSSSYKKKGIPVGDYLVNGGSEPALTSDRYGNGKVPTFVPSGQSDGGGFSSGAIYGQELVTAITQIAYQDENTTKKLIPSSVSTSQPPNKASTNPWQKVEAPSLESNLPSVSDNYFGAHNGFVNSVELAGAPIVAPGGSNGSSVVPVTSNTVDVSSDTVSNSSTDDSRGVNVAGAAQHGDSKPLSFARIASLNIDKQPVCRPGVLGNMGGTIGTPVGTPPISSNNGSLQQQTLLSNLRGPSSATHPGHGHFDHHHPSSSLMLPSPHTSLPASMNPRFYLDIVMEGKKLGRVIIEVEPIVAPKMSQNFQMLITGDKGFGYRGCQFFQAWKNESVICGDWEHNSGRGGRAAFDGGTLFTPDDTKLACVASQFRIILANMHTQFSGIFGHVVSGIEALDKVANVGGEGGRPEKKIASNLNFQFCVWGADCSEFRGPTGSHFDTMLCNSQQSPPVGPQSLSAWTVFFFSSNTVLYFRLIKQCLRNCAALPRRTPGIPCGLQLFLLTWYVVHNTGLEKSGIPALLTGIQHTQWVISAVHHGADKFS
ncbi:unnamed protein product [Lepeophtheirus salmonis]|uniref:(salmon louse) hypothetical protein n=1 Tax=Lepeophtheirus salmonis TaxID=72036 RepID=A0A7R8CC27_LEPSM|nr:unnamed protein product [Lepeophtheirus salmonis]CAF2759141.1 unnamed protein product [Lepeophtheirus salmonis]